MKSTFLKRISSILVSVIATLIFLPVVTYAFTVAFYYDADRNELSGYMYHQDPTSVTIKLTEVDSTVTSVTYATYGTALYDSGYYDDANNNYKVANFLVANVEEFPASMEINSDGTTYQLIQQDWEWNDGGFAYGLPVNLDSYRIVGTEYLSSKYANSILSPGSNIASFTPHGDSSTGIKIWLPHNQSYYTSLNKSNIVKEDFVVIDTTSSEQIAIDEINLDIYMNSDTPVDSLTTIALGFDTTLIPGHIYQLKLSSTSSGNEITLPRAGDYSLEVRVGQIGHYTFNNNNYTYFASYDVLFKQITLVNAPIVDTEPSNPVPAAVGPTPLPVDKEKAIIDDSSFTKGIDGKIAIPISKETKEVLLPIQAAKLAGSNNVEIDKEGMTLSIPPEILQQLQNLLDAGELQDDAQISLQFDKATDDERNSIIKEAASKTNAGIKLAGDVYDFKLSVLKKDGSSISLSKFDKPIIIKLKMADGANEQTVGVYHINDQGEIEYVGGKIVEGYIQAELTHFSKYAVIEYDKTFSDVPNSHWANSAIKEMVAKHVAVGISEDRFEPNQRVKRAEFVAFITRALGLKSESAISFKDVDTKAWYYDAVVAAINSGLLVGKSKNSFDPDSWISREEMVTVIMRAYELQNGTIVDSIPSSSTFIDKDQISKWALKSVDSAYAANLVSGRSDHKFDPRGYSTRAEALYMISQLLKKIK